MVFLLLRYSWSYHAVETQCWQMATVVDSIWIRRGELRVKKSGRLNDRKIWKRRHEARKKMVQGLLPFRVEFRKGIESGKKRQDGECWQWERREGTNGRGRYLCEQPGRGVRGKNKKKK